MALTNDQLNLLAQAAKLLNQDIAGLGGSPDVFVPAAMTWRDLENIIAEPSTSSSPGMSGRSAIPETNRSAASVTVVASKDTMQRRESRMSLGVVPSRRMPAMYITAGIGNRRKLTALTAQDDELAGHKMGRAHPLGHRL